MKKRNLQNEGLYLEFDNGKFMDLSRQRIQKLADEYWNDPTRLSDRMRKDDAFKTCSICPYRGQDVLCSAMKPLLPFLEKMEDFLSYHEVNATYIDQLGNRIFARTTLQHALQYVTNMALFEYCEDTKQYFPFFRGIHPLMPHNEAFCRIYLNIYWLKKGDMDQINETIRELQEAVTVTCDSCIKRLNVICHSDAFKNAYANTQIFTKLFSLEIEEALENYFHL